MTAIWRHDESGWRPLAPTGFPDEATLHRLVEDAPQILPLAGGPRLVVVGREVALGPGSADLVAVEPTGRLAIIEVKLARNAEARRAVIAQVLMYAAYLSGLDLTTRKEKLTTLACLANRPNQFIPLAGLHGEHACVPIDMSTRSADTQPMHKRSSMHAHRRDLHELTTSVVSESADEALPEPRLSAPEKNPHAAALGRLGGVKGGKARAAKLTAEQRRAIASKAARARWRPEQ